MGLSSAGIGSGLDVKSLVASLVAAEIEPRQKNHDNKLSSINTKISAVGQLKSSLTNLQSVLSNLSDLSKLYKLKGQSSDENSLTANISSKANPGTYQIQVQTLAQAHSVASNAFSTTTAGGNLNIRFGSYSEQNTVFTPNTNSIPDLQVAINAGDSLEAIKTAINKTNAGVIANIIQDSTGSRLTLTSQTGENYAMQISGVAELTFDPTSDDPASKLLSQTVAAQNSTVLINGLALTQNTNQLQDAISGVTLNLKKDQTGPIMLSIESDKEGMSHLINEFVSKYNESMTLLNNLTKYDADKKQSGVYMGDSQLRSLKMNISKLATNRLSGNSNSPIQSLADLGIKTNQRTGLLDSNSDSLSTALSANYADIGALFAKTAQTTDPNIRVRTVNGSVPAGNYEININQSSPTLVGTIGDFNADSTDAFSLNGSGPLSGLFLDVLTNSVGRRGEVNVVDGIACTLNNLIDEYVSKSGNLSKKTEQLQGESKLMEEMQQKLTSRSQTLERRYFKQFSSLDVLIGQMQSTSSYLSQQLSNLPGFTTNKNK